MRPGKLIVLSGCVYLILKKKKIKAEVDDFASGTGPEVLTWVCPENLSLETNFHGTKRPHASFQGGVTNSHTQI